MKIKTICARTCNVYVYDILFAIFLLSKIYKKYEITYIIFFELPINLLYTNRIRNNIYRAAMTSQLSLCPNNAVRESKVFFSPSFLFNMDTIPDSAVSLRSTNFALSASRSPSNPMSSSNPLKSTTLGRPCLNSVLTMYTWLDSQVFMYIFSLATERTRQITEKTHPFHPTMRE